ncbi:hypothetical protein ACMGD3_22655 [Lysinibacillus sphaericus]|uniref:hypothetical protein n=1 Tax=Lysinibacillus sphaericus TaxID=1421 RepID=UPI001C5EF86F
MKKLIYSITLVLCFGLVGCSTSDKEESKPKTENIPPVEKVSTDKEESNVYQEYHETTTPLVKEILQNNALLEQYQQELSIGIITLDDFGLLVTYELIPANDEITKKVESLKVEDELVGIHETLITMLNKLNYALLEISGAINTSDSSRMTTAIEYLDEVKKYEREFARELTKHTEVGL